MSTELERDRTRAVERLQLLAEAAERTAAECGGQIATATAMVRRTLARGGKLLFCGNGGSAADAQHLATEYVVRYVKSRRAMPAIALTTDTSILTAAGNDLGFDQVFARQVEALGRPGDLLIIHSTSGQSPNVLRAAAAARAGGLEVLALSARDGGPLRHLADHCIVVPAERTDVAQELHLCIGHLICEAMESTL